MEFVFIVVKLVTGQETSFALTAKCTIQNGQAGHKGLRLPNFAKTRWYILSKFLLHREVCQIVQPCMLKIDASTLQKNSSGSPLSLSFFFLFRKLFALHFLLTQVIFILLGSLIGLKIRQLQFPLVMIQSRLETKHWLH